MQDKPFLKWFFSLFYKLVSMNVIIVFLTILSAIFATILVRLTVMLFDGSFPALCSGVTMATFQLVGSSPRPSGVLYMVVDKVAIYCAICLSALGCI